MTFQLDERLNNDCFVLAESDSCLVLLLNNCHFPWFIVVPKTVQTELYLLPEVEQLALQKQTNLISEFVHINFDCDKLNVASIGNIVSQMHMHIIARNENDPCWPGVVWGTSFQKAYSIEDAVIIQHKLQSFYQDKVINNFVFAPLQ